MKILKSVFEFVMVMSFLFLILCGESIVDIIFKSMGL